MATINADGSFQATTFLPGDGMIPGQYRVAAFNPVAMNPEAKTPQLRIDVRYASYETSKLHCEIQQGAANQLEFVLDRP